MKVTQLVLGSLTVLMAAFSSCTKEDVQESNQLEEINSRMTLEEFLDARGDQEASDFLLTIVPVDNTELTERAIGNGGDRLLYPKFPWEIGFGTGCVGCFGWCSDPSDPFGDPTSFPFPWGEITQNVVAGLLDVGTGELKLQLYPRPEVLECAITEDGLFPIEEEIALTETACDIFELPHGTVVPAGVYMANFDIEAGEYTSVTLDLMY
ncbi:MAG: hypothetical protein GQ574_07795 [Crocinitomix sp.]|nr:hypothetical protein [Crocinitomix sp.]